jgi:hypothetical protein
LLLEIDEAGFLEEYTWYAGQRQFGAPAETWLAEHPERVASFLGWAREAGYLNDDSREGELTTLEGFRELPGTVAEWMTESEMVYQINLLEEGEGGDAPRFLDAERQRFRRLKLGGDDRIVCKRVAKTLDTDLAVRQATALIQVLRCFVPGDDAYELAALRAGGLGLELDEVTFAVRADIRLGEAVENYADAQPALMAWALAAAAWRSEPDLRAEHGGPEPTDAASLAEALFVTAATAGAYVNSREVDPADPEAEPAPESDVLERLITAVESDDFLGFVLYEVIHKHYGRSLDRLSTNEANAVVSYLHGYVLRRRLRE